MLRSSHGGKREVPTGGSTGLDAFFAHSKNSSGVRQGLVSHLENVAELAARFATSIGAATLGHYLGLVHDIGKFDPAFQRYLVACETGGAAAPARGPDHKGAGALIAREHVGLTALLIDGHHGGLRSPVEVEGWLAARQQDPAVQEASRRAGELCPAVSVGPEAHLPAHVERDARAAELFLRLLFSALLDADFLDTEQHFRPERRRLRVGSVSLHELWERFEHNQCRLPQNRDTVGRARSAIYSAALSAAELSPGIFRLTAPTGAGKTRTSMAFALRHALRHDQRRIIVALPFITITEQTADVYRRIFEEDAGGEPVVLEHHSGAVRSERDDDFHMGAVQARLAAENWDAPIVVTTTVQLFESLFARSTSACRKLHNVARSVIVLDEAQALPPHLLEPILDVLRELSIHYGTTVVLSTATQPAFEAIPAFAKIRAREIVPEPSALFAAVRRVRYEWCLDRVLGWDELSERMTRAAQALAILNTKGDALALLDALDDPNALHLSTLLCGAHRRRVIGEIRRRLAANEPCRLIATQVVEAGVDLDFPLVLRALGPLDAVIQAAGRCNREGRLERGEVVVFRGQGENTPPGVYRAASNLTLSLLSAEPDPDDPEIARAFFRRLYATVETDRDAIQSLRARLEYPEVARRFRMIDDETESVIVRYGTRDERQLVESMVDCLRAGAAATRVLLRRLQPYLVSVHVKQADQYRRLGMIAPIREGIGEWMGHYDDVRGLVTDVNPDTFVV